MQERCAWNLRPEQVPTTPAQSRPSAWLERARGALQGQFSKQRPHAWCHSMIVRMLPWRPCRQPTNPTRTSCPARKANTLGSRGRLRLHLGSSVHCQGDKWSLLPHPGRPRAAPSWKGRLLPPLPGPRGFPVASSSDPEGSGAGKAAGHPQPPVQGALAVVNLDPQRQGQTHGSWGPQWMRDPVAMATCSPASSSSPLLGPDPLLLRMS